MATTDIEKLKQECSSDDPEHCRFHGKLIHEAEEHNKEVAEATKTDLTDKDKGANGEGGGKKHKVAELAETIVNLWVDVDKMVRRIGAVMEKDKTFFRRFNPEIKMLNSLSSSMYNSARSARDLEPDDRNIELARMRLAIVNENAVRADATFEKIKDAIEAVERGEKYHAPCPSVDTLDHWADILSKTYGDLEQVRTKCRHAFGWQMNANFSQTECEMRLESILTKSLKNMGSEFLEAAVNDEVGVDAYGIPLKAEFAERCANDIFTELDDLILARAEKIEEAKKNGEPMPYEEVSHNNSANDQQYFAFANAYFNKYVKPGMKTVKAWTGMTEKRGGRDLLLNAMYRCLAAEPSSRFGDDGIYDRLHLNDLARAMWDWVRYSPESCLERAKAIRTNREIKARRLASQVALNAEFAKGVNVDNADERRKDIIDRMRRKMPSFMTESAKSVLDSAPYEMLAVIDNANITFKAKRGTSNKAECSCGNVISVGSGDWANHRVTLGHEFGHAVLNMMGIHANVDKAPDNIVEICDTAREEAADFAQKTFGDTWMARKEFKNRTKNLTACYRELFTTVYGGAESEFVDANDKKQWAGGLSDAMCAALGGEMFCGHTRNYFAKKRYRKMHELIANVTAMILTNDVYGMAAMPRTVAMVKERLFHMTDKSKAE